MFENVLQRIYVLLDGTDEGQFESFARMTPGLLSHVNLTGNLYLVTKDLPASMSHIERI